MRIASIRFGMILQQLLSERWQKVQSTRRRIYKPPTPAPLALADLESWFESPSLRLIAETSRYWQVIRNVIESSAAAGPMVHDARIAAIFRAHGVTTLLSADRDFSRFGISVRNPLITKLR